MDGQKCSPCPKNTPQNRTCNPKQLMYMGWLPMRCRPFSIRHCATRIFHSEALYETSRAISAEVKDEIDIAAMYADLPSLDRQIKLTTEQ
jgi:hypothetical protein